MNMPFTTEQFLGVFQSYNETVWPMQVVLNLLGAGAILLAVKKRTYSAKSISIILAFLWLWMGVVYHLLHFTSINKAAYIFGSLCIVQAGVFLYTGILKKSPTFQCRPDRYGFTGAAFLLYAMVIYPILGSVVGHTYPRSPTFGLPCPTTIFTFGILLWAERRVHLQLLVIPFLWSITGFTAALSMGMLEDIGLLVAGVTGTLLIVIRNRIIASN